MLELNQIKYKDGAGIFNNLYDILNHNKKETPRYIYRMSIAPLITPDKPNQMVTLLRIGNIVNLSCNIDCTYKTGQTTILSNIPEGYRTM